MYFHKSKYTRSATLIILGYTDKLGQVATIIYILMIAANTISSGRCMCLQVAVKFLPLNCEEYNCITHIIYGHTHTYIHTHTHTHIHTHTHTLCVCVEGGGKRARCTLFMHAHLQSDTEVSVFSSKPDYSL